MQFHRGGGGLHSAHMTGRNWEFLLQFAIFLPKQTILQPHIVHVLLVITLGCGGGGIGAYVMLVVGPYPRCIVVPPPLCNSYAPVIATVGVGTILILYFGVAITRGGGGTYYK